MPAPLPSFLALILGMQALAAQEAHHRCRQEGRVVDVLGRPVPAAMLRIVSAGVAVARGLSDGEGIYSLRGPETGSAEIVVSAPGKATRRLSWRPVDGTRTENIVLPDAGRLSGTLTDAIGRPVARAAVVVAGREASMSTVTDERGRYELAGAPLDLVTLRAWGPDSFVERQFALAGDRTVDLELPVLGGGGPRRLRVRGVPVEVLAAAFVEITAKDQAVREKTRMPLRPDGSLEFLPGDTSLVCVRIPGYATAPSGILVERSGGGELVFVGRATGALQDNLVARGRIVDVAGTPATGTRVVLEDRFCARLGTAVVNGDGFFEIRTAVPDVAFARLGIEFGDWQFEGATTKGGASWLDFEPPAAGQQLLPTFRVVPTTRLFGECVTGDGRRLAFAEVVIVAAANPQVAVARVWTDRTGAFAVAGLPVDDYALAAIGERGELLIGEAGLGEGERVRVPKWKAVPSGGLAGVVVDGTGAPRPGVRVRVVSPELWHAQGEMLGGRIDTWVTTDREGRFRCEGLHAGEWLVAVPDAALAAAEHVDVAAGRTAPVEIKLP